MHELLGNYQTTFNEAANTKHLMMSNCVNKIPLKVKYLPKLAELNPPNSCTQEEVDTSAHYDLSPLTALMEQAKWQPQNQTPSGG